MKKRQLSIFTCAALLTSLITLPGCIREVVPPPVPSKKGILAIVYTDLTKSIDEPTAIRQKENIAELFQNLAYDAKFYLFSIDRGTSKPNIYKFLPSIPKVETAEDEDKLAEAKKNIETAKTTTELEKLNSSLDSYHGSITKEKGPVSCITNKLNSLIDTIANMRADFPDYDIRVFFYSDMIEQCQNSFDAKPLDFERSENDGEEQKHLADIQNRIEKNFAQASPKKNLKSLEAKVYIVLTSQDDKQNLVTLKTIWNSFFKKLGLESDEIVWANGNGRIFWTLATPELSAQK
jgi:hypothetical protein